MPFGQTGVFIIHCYNKNMNLPSENRGFIVTSNLMLGSVIFVIVGVFGFNFFSEDQATTTLLIEPQTTNLNVEEDFIIDVVVTTRVPMNALEATLRFPPDFIEVKEIVLNSPIIDIWVFEPNYSNEEGFVTFTGGTTRSGGVVGKSNIVSIVFTPKRSGKIELEFTHSLVLQHDGVGTDLEESAKGADFIIKELENKESVNVVTRSSSAAYEIKSTAPPSPDLDNNGNVSISDLSAFLPSLRKEYDESRDFNQDGKVNIKDVSIIMAKILSE